MELLIIFPNRMLKMFKARKTASIACLCLIIFLFLLTVVHTFLGRMGTISNIKEVELISGLLVMDKLSAFPTVGPIDWSEHLERPRRFRLAGHTDVRKYYLWFYGYEMSRNDLGMASITKPHPKGEIGNLGDRFYEFDGTTSSCKYQGRVLLDGRFQLDLIQFK